MPFPVVEVSLHAGQERTLYVGDAAGGWLAIHELGVTARARRAMHAITKAEPNGHDVAVVVTMLHGGVLGDVDRSHGTRC